MDLGLQISPSNLLVPVLGVIAFVSAVVGSHVSADSTPAHSGIGVGVVDRGVQRQDFDQQFFSGWHRSTPVRGWACRGSSHNEDTCRPTSQTPGVCHAPGTVVWAECSPRQGCSYRSSGVRPKTNGPSQRGNVMDFWFRLLFFLFRRLDNPSLQPKDRNMVLKIYRQLNLQYSVSFLRQCLPQGAVRSNTTLSLEGS